MIYNSAIWPDPPILFRIFNYPPAAEIGDMPWGVGEHKSRSGWLDAPPIPRTFVCNIGDMLDRLIEAQPTIISVLFRS